LVGQAVLPAQPALDDRQQAAEGAKPGQEQVSRFRLKVG
jgi:hypothetical protein